MVEREEEARKKSTAIAAKPSLASREGALFACAVDIIEPARRHVARSVNYAMVHAYWMIGREIVEVEQHGKKRAGFGDELLARLAKHLTSKVGRGFGPHPAEAAALLHLLSKWLRTAEGN